MMPPLFLIIIILAPEFFQFPVSSHPRAWTTAPAAATSATAATAPRPVQQLDLGIAITPEQVQQQQEQEQQPRNSCNSNATHAGDRTGNSTGKAIGNASSCNYTGHNRHNTGNRDKTDHDQEYSITITRAGYNYPLTKSL
jgi:hypothetical protein